MRLRTHPLVALASSVIPGLVLGLYYRAGFELVGTGGDSAIVVKRIGG